MLNKIKYMLYVLNPILHGRVEVKCPPIDCFMVNLSKKSFFSSNQLESRFKFIYKYDNFCNLKLVEWRKVSQL